MKTMILLTLSVVLALNPFAHAADSKRTVEYILANSAEYENKEVTLDVAFVKPAQAKSPLSEFAFFHATTIDRRDRKPGGHILVAIPAENSGAFAKKYGMDFDGRSDSDTLRGTLMAAPGHRGRARVWVLDTTGKLAELIKAKKIELTEERFDEGVGRGEGMGRREGLRGRSKR